MLAPMSGEQKRLAWAVVKRFVLAAAGAAGARLAERAVDWFLGDQEDDDDSDEPRTTE